MDRRYLFFAVALMVPIALEAVPGLTARIEDHPPVPW